MIVKRVTLGVMVLIAILVASLPARATTYTWTGGDGSSDSWYSPGNWGGSGPSDGAASDYVFAASGWNTAQTTIVVDGVGSCPDVQSLTFNGDVNIPLTIQIGSDNCFLLDPSSTNATTISVAQTGVTQTIAGSSGASIQLADNQQWSVDGALAISAVIWDDGESPSPGFVKSGAGTLILSGANSFSGPITINQGVVSVSTIANTGQVGNLGRGSLALNGGVLLYTGTGANVSTTRGFTLGTSGGTIDVQNAPTSLTFSGTVTGQGGLTKTGSGGLVLGGVSNYTGVTTVQSGTLQINNASSTMNVLTNAGDANVSGGFLVLDYSANMANENGLVSTVQSLLHTAYNGGTNSFQSGYGYQLYSTAASNSVGVGWVDNTTTHQITIMPALYGDATLDGVVGPADLSKLLTNYGKSGMTWSQGDFTYDGIVGPADLSKLLTNYGKNGPLNINDIPALALQALEADSQAMQLLASYDISVSGATAVPEPSSLVMLASLLALAGVWGFRRQRNVAG